MIENKANILRFLCISLGFILLTYVVSIFGLGWTYLTKDFLLSIFSGISASSFVVVFSELIKYNLNKKNIENALYGNLRELYCQLTKQIRCTEMLLSNPKMNVAENVYSANVPEMTNFLNTIRFLQYEPFISNSFVTHLKNFQQNEMFLFEKYLSACMTFLQISILKIKIEKTEHGMLNYSPTSSDENIVEVLKKMRSEAEKRCNILDDIIVSLDSICKHRFSWEKDKAIIDEVSFYKNSENIQSFFEDK